MKTTFLDFEQPIAELETKIEELKKTMEGSDDNAIRNAMNELGKASHKIAEKLYAQKADAEHQNRDQHLDEAESAFLSPRSVALQPPDAPQAMAID